MTEWPATELSVKPGFLSISCVINIHEDSFLSRWRAWWCESYWWDHPWRAWRPTRSPVLAGTMPLFVILGCSRTQRWCYKSLLLLNLLWRDWKHWEDKIYRLITNEWEINYSGQKPCIIMASPRALKPALRALTSRENITVRCYCTINASYLFYSKALIKKASLLSSSASILPHETNLLLLK